MSPSSTTQEPKSIPAYKIRTMAGDIEALKKGSVPLHSEIIIKPSSLDQNSAQVQIKPSFPKIEPLKPPVIEPKRLEINKEERIKPEFSKPLISPPPLSPKPYQPFETPIKKPIMPPENLNQQSKTQSPPPGLPTEPPRLSRPVMPPRPLTPPPIQQQTSKLPPLPPLPVSRPNLPPLPPIPSRQAGAPFLPSKKGGKGKLILIGAVSVLILSFVVGEIWWFFLRQQPAPDQANTQDILPPPQELQPLLPVDQTPQTTNTPETQFSPPITPVSGLLAYDPTAQVMDVVNVAKINSNDVTEDTLVKLIVQKNTVDSATGQSSATDITTIDELIKYLKIKIPATVKNQFSSEFDIFAFGGNETFDKIECAKIKNAPVSCYGPRLGIAIKVLDPAKIYAPLKAWEKTMVTDLKPLILSRVGSAVSATFQTGTYQDQTIRYKNLPINTVTVEYALVNDVLVITTSKSAMLKAIDSSVITNP